MHLGLRKKDPAEAIDYFERAERLDASLAGPVRTWMAVIREHEQKTDRQTPEARGAAQRARQPGGAALGDHEGG